MTDTKNKLKLTLSEYLHFIGFDEFTINLVKNDTELTKEIMYNLMHLWKKQGNKEIIQEIIEKYSFS